MLTKGSLTKAMNAVSLWLKTEFPSQETEKKLQEQGWRAEYKSAPSMGMHFGATGYTVRYTPEGKTVAFGSEEHKRYKDAVRAIVESQQPKP